MANRYTKQFVNVFNKGVTVIYARVSFGSSGAPTLVTSTNTSSIPTETIPQSQGVLSIVQNGTGDYTFTFGSQGQTSMTDLYVTVLSGFVVFNTGSATIPAAPLMNFRTLGVSTTGTIRVNLYGAGGSAANPASGEVGLFCFCVSNSNAP